jgi:hypothetical protein
VCFKMALSCRTIIPPTEFHVPIVLNTPPRLSPHLVSHISTLRISYLNRSHIISFMHSVRIPINDTIYYHNPARLVSQCTTRHTRRSHIPHLDISHFISQHPYLDTSHPICPHPTPQVAIDHISYLDISQLVFQSFAHHNL